MKLIEPMISSWFKIEKDWASQNTCKFYRIHCHVAALSLLQNPIFKKCHHKTIAWIAQSKGYKFMESTMHEIQHKTAKSCAMWNNGRVSICLWYIPKVKTFCLALVTSFRYEWGKGWSNSPVNWQEKHWCYFWPHVIGLEVLNIAFLSSFSIIGHSIFSILTAFLWIISKFSMCFL